MSGNTTTSAATEEMGKLTALLADCITGIDHVAIAVADLEEAISWYTNALGFKLLECRTTRGEHTSMISAVVQAGAAVVVLIQGVEPDSQVSRFVEKFGPGVQHFALGVSDLSVAMRRLAKAGGLADTPIIEDDGMRQVFLHRSRATGVRIELIERKGGDFSDASVQKLFRTFEQNELY